jgi:pSer/pThr/pTyr-binding forkhead associated (FHA) protein
MKTETRDPIWLQGVSASHQEEKYLVTREEFFIGRAPECDLVIDEDTVSARHARIFATGTGWHLEDRDSANGTRLNGEKISRAPLHSGDLLTIESRQFQFFNTREIQLQGTDGSHRHQQYYLTGEELTIGRSPTCRLVLSEKTVSGEHALIFRKDGEWWIRDLDSTNGTRVNQTPVTLQSLRSGDLITIESLTFKFINPLDVERTVLPHPDIPPTRIHEGKKADTAMMPEPRPVSASRAKQPSPRWTRGLVLGLLFALLVNTGLPFITAVMKLPQVTGRNLGMVLTGILGRLSLLHLPTHWIRFLNRDAASFVIMGAVVLGLLGGGYITRRTGPKNAVTAPLIFSLVYILSAGILQLAVLRGNLTRFLNQFTLVGIPFATPLTAFLAGTGLSLLTAFFWAFLGGLAAGGKTRTVETD